MKNNKKGLGIILTILAVIFGAYVISPDPLPIVVDDIGSIIAMAGSILGAIKAFKGKNQNTGSDSGFNDVNDN